MIRENSLFDIPRLDYFQFWNEFTGSWQGFNYRLMPEKGEEPCLKASVWQGLWCSSKSEMAAEQAFPLTEEGLEQMIAWLEEQRKKMEEWPEEIR
ncbi:MAG: hypothetical protein PHD67_07840 [Oscillospiraceae bacterium]|nr:hypothetical protein [Oscillospiraceae bacterium]